MLHQDAENSKLHREEEEQGEEEQDAESGTAGPLGRGYNDIDTETEGSRSTQQVVRPESRRTKVSVSLHCCTFLAFGFMQSVLLPLIAFHSIFARAWGYGITM